MKYRFADTKQPRTRRYRLPLASPVHAPTPRKPLLTAPLGTVRGSYANEIATLDRRRAQSTQHTSTRVERFQVFAPANDYSTIAAYDLRVADELPMPDLFGQLKLSITPESVDLNRVANGQVNFLLDHDEKKPAGRISSASIEKNVLFMQTQIADIPRGHDLVRDMEAGLRRGVSFGFLVGKVDVQDDGDSLLTVVEEFEVFEATSTTVPRGKLSRVLRTSMAYQEVRNMNGHTLESGSRLVSTSDPDGLSLVCGRLAMGQVKDPVKRKRLQSFYERFDALISAGSTRDVAIAQALGHSGIA